MSSLIYNVSVTYGHVFFFIMSITIKVNSLKTKNKMFKISYNHQCSIFVQKRKKRKKENYKFDFFKILIQI